MATTVRKQIDEIHRALLLILFAQQHTKQDALCSRGGEDTITCWKLSKESQPENAICCSVCMLCQDVQQVSKAELDSTGGAL